MIYLFKIVLFKIILNIISLIKYYSIIKKIKYILIQLFIYKALLESILLFKFFSFNKISLFNLLLSIN